MTTTGEPAQTAAIDDLAAWIGAYTAALANQKTWGEVAERAKLQITQHLDTADAQIGTIAGRPAVKWTHVVTRRLDTKTLKEKDPELAEQYTVETTSRRFTVLEQTGNGQVA